MALEYDTPGDSYYVRDGKICGYESSHCPRCGTRCGVNEIGISGAGRLRINNGDIDAIEKKLQDMGMTKTDRPREIYAMENGDCLCEVCYFGK